MPQTVDEVKKDLENCFGFDHDKVKSKFFDDYAKIGSYLSNPADYKDALKKLDDEMENQFLTRLLQENKNSFVNDAKSSVIMTPFYTVDNDQKYTEEEEKKFSKLLTNTLQKNETYHQFSTPMDNQQTDILIGLPERFNDLLKNGKPFKDIGAGYQHGEYSHRIQWYLITQMKNLQHLPIEIYKGLPGWNTKRVDTYTKPRPFYMWEFLVDRDGVPTNASSIPFKTKEQTDFRAPSNVNTWLVEQGAERYYWLHTCLKKRWEKREKLDLLFYIANKVLKKNLKNPKDMDQETFAEAAAYYKKGIFARS